MYPQSAHAIDLYNGMRIRDEVFWRDKFRTTIAISSRLVCRYTCNTWEGVI